VIRQWIVRAADGVIVREYWDHPGAIDPEAESVFTQAAELPDPDPRRQRVEAGALRQATDAEIAAYDRAFKIADAGAASLADVRALAYVTADALGLNRGLFARRVAAAKRTLIKE
jgi:hypothetical protein